MTSRSAQLVPILMAEDDEDDRMLFQDALQESRFANPIYFAHDGEELLDFLRHKGKFADPVTSPSPGLILLDLNMPKKDGRQALAEIKSDPMLRSIPIVVLTTSKEEQDVVRSYDLGVNSFIVKPVTFVKLLEVVTFVGQYWLELVKLPGQPLS